MEKAEKVRKRESRLYSYKREEIERERNRIE
jgi:hypothetical protein